VLVEAQREAYPAWGYGIADHRIPVFSFVVLRERGRVEAVGIEAVTDD
jgi:hypothetical protein